MTNADKRAWLNQASNEELLRQLVSLIATNSYGSNDEDINLTRGEILSRMEAK